MRTLSGGRREGGIFLSIFLGGNFFYRKIIKSHKRAKKKQKNRGQRRGEMCMPLRNRPRSWYGMGFSSSSHMHTRMGVHTKAYTPIRARTCSFTSTTASTTLHTTLQIHGHEGRRLAITARFGGFLLFLVLLFRWPRGWGVRSGCRAGGFMGSQLVSVVDTDMVTVNDHLSECYLETSRG